MTSRIDCLKHACAWVSLWRGVCVSLHVCQPVPGWLRVWQPVSGCEPHVSLGMGLGVA